MTLHTNPGGLLEDDATVPPSFFRPLGLRRTQLVLAFNATQVFDLSVADVFYMTLTGNVVPGAPTWAGTALGAAHAGLEFRLVWIQDGTGTRTVTYSNGIFAVTGAPVLAVDTTALTRTIDDLYFDAGKVRLLTRRTGQT